MDKVGFQEQQYREFRPRVKYVVIHGGVGTDPSYRGPFDDPETAVHWAIKMSLGAWRIAPITAPHDGWETQ